MICSTIGPLLGQPDIIGNIRIGPGSILWNAVYVRFLCHAATGRFFSCRFSNPSTLPSRIFGHVRGFTKDASSGVKGGGTFEGLRQKIPYLKDLGINAVELMPIFEFDEMESARVVDGVQLYNYWGYNTVSFFAPNTSYAFHQEHNHEGDELKRLIRELKENGIEVILDVVFNHSAWGMKR